MANKIVIMKDTSFGKQDGTRDFYTHFFDALHKNGLLSRVQAVRAADMGIYGQGMVLQILPDDVTYRNVLDADIERIIESSVKSDKVLQDLLYKPKPRQLRIVLRNCGKIDPENIDDYLANDGYQGLRKALKMSPEQVIGEIRTSGLRGRGGAGYPTWLKWTFCRNVKSEQKYVICNGDEGDPGAYMDRSVLEGDPHSVIEGMIIAGYAIGATKGYFYIRAEYPLAVDRIQKALDQCRKAKLLKTEGILGSKFSFDAEVRLGAGAFVCGEETALIASIEGKRGSPSPRPPYPTTRGLWGKPTVINNVETLANVPYILNKGGVSFAKIGTEKSKGTKVFAVTGKIKNSGLVEVPMGTTLREIVFDICGGTISGKEVLAVQTGGPSGGVIPKEYLDTPVDYENLQKLGSIMGSGGMIVMDTDDCMVDIAKFYLGFCVDESCGKCVPCRIGGYQSLYILNRICDGQGKIEDLAALNQIFRSMVKASLCGLGQNSPNPVLSTMRYFEPEYRQHILEKKCRAGKCRKLTRYEIDRDLCRSCGVCATQCPFRAIVGDRVQGFTIHAEECTQCGRCEEACKFSAIKKE
jgi:NADH:ubiquinone oxidoreductase subunit F (NADH-binding)